LEFQTNESRFREGDLLVLLLQTIMVDALDAQIEMPSNLITASENCLQDCQAASQNALLDKAALLLSESMRNRLVLGKGEPFIDALLETNSPKSMADILIEQLAKPRNGEFEKKLELLRRCFQRIAVEFEQERS
jgi:hypothetical protein